MSYICGIDGCRALKPGLTDCIIEADELAALRQDAKRWHEGMPVLGAKLSAAAERILELEALVMEARPIMRYVDPHTDGHKWLERARAVLG